MRYSASKKVTKLVMIESIESEPVNGFASSIKTDRHKTFINNTLSRP
jgi:hypothetical protein